MLLMEYFINDGIPLTITEDKNIAYMLLTLYTKKHYFQSEPNISLSSSREWSLVSTTRGIKYWFQLAGYVG